MLGAGVMLSACAPVQMGAAAIVGNQRISQATLSSKTADLKNALAKYPAQEVQMTPARAPQAVLGLLVQFGIWDRIAKDNGISLTPAQARNGEQLAQNQFRSDAVQQLEQMQQEGASVSPSEVPLLTSIMALNNGVSPQLMSEYGRSVAEQVALMAKLNGGKPVTTQAEYTKLTPKLTAAVNKAVKELNIKVNPQYGKFDPSQGTVVAGPDTLSKPASSPSAAAAPAAG